MFRRSGPGHMLLHTVLKLKVQGRISLSLVKVKAKFAQTEVYKDSPMEKIDPLRSNPALSPTVPLLLCPHGPSMPIFFSSFADTKPPPIIRARQAPHTWGRLGAFGFYGKHADWLKQNSPQSMKWLSRCSMLTHDLYCDISSRHFWKWAFSRKAMFVSSLAVSFPIMFHKSPTKTAVEAVWVLFPPINC